MDSLGCASKMRCTTSAISASEVLGGVRRCLRTIFRRVFRFLVVMVCLLVLVVLYLHTSPPRTTLLSYCFFEIVNGNRLQSVSVSLACVCQSVLNHGRN